MKNETNQELMNAAKGIVEKLKTIQIRCKENDIDLKAFLSKQEYKDYQEALAFIKKYPPIIKADALALKSQPENKEPIDEDISEPAFIDAVLQWRKTLLKDLKTTKAKYAEVAIDPSKFSASIGSNLSALPLNTSLYKEWENIVAKIPSPSTGAIIFEALIQNSSETWVLTGNIDKLTSHYRKAANKKVYKQYEDTRIDAALPQIALFIAAIEASANSKDSNLPENRAAAEKAKEEEAKAKAEEAKELLDLFNVWKKEFSAEMSKEDTLHDKNLVSFGKLKKNLKVALGYTEAYTKPIIEALSTQLKEKAFAAGDSITVKELKHQLIEITLTLDKHIDWKTQMELWRTNRLGFMFPIPPAVHTAITDSELNVSEERFIELVQETVYSKNLSIIDTIAQNKKWEKVKDSRELIFDGAILKSEFQIAFSKKIQSITPLEFVYNELAENIGEGKVSLDNFKLIWEKSMQESYKKSKDNSSSVYHEWLAKETLWKVEQALDSLAAFFPTEAVITSVLEEARIVPNKKVMPKLHQYGNGRTTDFTCSIAWKSVESIFEVAGKEVSNQSSLTKITESLKSLGKGVELVMEELEGIGGPLRLNISNITFDVKIPMKLTQQFDSKGGKFVAAVPNNLDSSYIKFKGDSGYFGVEVLRIEPLTELPKFDGRNFYDYDSFVSMQDIKLTLEISDPQVSISLSSLGGVELAKQPTKCTVDLIFTIYSSYNLKENSVTTNVKSMTHTGGGRIIKYIKITKKEKLELEVFK